MEALTIVSLIEVIRQPVEQIVDSPVPRGRLPGLQGFLPGQSYCLTAEQIVDNPVPRPGGGGGLQGLHRGLFNSVFGADCRVSRSSCRSSRFSVSPGSRSELMDAMSSADPVESLLCLRLEIGVAGGVRRIVFLGRVRRLVQQWTHVLREPFGRISAFSTVR